VTLPPYGLLATGLYWKGGSSVITLAEPGGHEIAAPLGPGTTVAWTIRGPRRCVGIWRPGSSRRQMCPHQARIAPEATTVQCPTCAAADPGRALARDGALDDRRTFALYLAYFGHGLLKIGITAAELGADRLSEQGTLAFGWLGQGALLTVRRAENLACTGGMVRDRIHRTAKISAWAQLEDPHQRLTHLQAAHDQLTATVVWPENLTRTPFQVQDLTGSYGLQHGPPPARHQATALRAGGALRGTLLCLAGRDSLLQTSEAGAAGEATVLQVDLRLLSGWLLMPDHGTRDSSSGDGPSVANAFETRPVRERARGGPGEDADDVLF
jgi:hypothetical protein